MYQNGLDTFICTCIPDVCNSCCWSWLSGNSFHFPLRCNECNKTPIEGPRYHCQVCADFDFCQRCFDRGHAHNHAFERIDNQGMPAIYVGSPGTQRKITRKGGLKKKKMRGGSVLMDWDQIVRHFSVSSNESSAHKLIDGVHTTYWQSSGPQGKVGGVNVINMPFSAPLLSVLCIALDPPGDPT